MWILVLKGLSASAGKNNLFLCLCFILPVDHGLDFESLVSLVLGPTETCESLLHFNMYALLKEHCRNDILETHTQTPKKKN